MEVLAPGTSFPCISISLYPEVLKESFPTAHPFLAQAPRNRDRRQKEWAIRKSGQVKEKEGGDQGSVREGPG